MPLSIVVIGAVEGVRQPLERYLRKRARLRIAWLVQRGGFRLEPRPENIVQMLNAAADEAVAEDYGDLLIIDLPYADRPAEVSDTVQALRTLGAAVEEPSPKVAPWPSRPKALDGKFQEALRTALEKSIGGWLASRSAAPDFCSYGCRPCTNRL